MKTCKQRRKKAAFCLMTLRLTNQQFSILLYSCVARITHAATKTCEASIKGSTGATLG